MGSGDGVLWYFRSLPREIRRPRGFWSGTSSRISDELSRQTYPSFCTRVPGDTLASTGSRLCWSFVGVPFCVHEAAAGAGLGFATLQALPAPLFCSAALLRGALRAKSNFLGCYCLWVLGDASVAARRGLRVLKASSW